MCSEHVFWGEADRSRPNLFHRSQQQIVRFVRFGEQADLSWSKDGPSVETGDSSRFGRTMFSTSGVLVPKSLSGISLGHTNQSPDPSLTDSGDTHLAVIWPPQAVLVEFAKLNDKGEDMSNGVS